MVFSYRFNICLLLLTVITVLLIFSFFPSDAFADEILNSVSDKYEKGLAAAYVKLGPYIVYFFWFLVGIAMVFQFGFLALEGLDWNKLFATWIRLLVFAAFFTWLLQDDIGPTAIKDYLIRSFRDLGDVAATAPTGTSGPVQSASDIVDLGVDIFSIIIKNGVSFRDLLLSLISALVALTILIIFTIVAVNLLIELIVTWFIVYMGIVVLGFGGLHLTREWAVAYIRTCVAQGLKLMTISFIVSLTYTIVNDYVEEVTQNLQSYAIMVNVVVYALIMFLLIQRVPNIIAGMVSGNFSSGPSGIASTLAGAAIATSIINKTDSFAGRMLGIKNDNGSPTGLVSRGMSRVHGATLNVVKGALASSVIVSRGAVKAAFSRALGINVNGYTSANPSTGNTSANPSTGNTSASPSTGNTTTNSSNRNTSAKGQKP